MKTKIIITAIILVTALGTGTTFYKLRNASTAIEKDSFTTYGSCSCPPDGNDTPEVIDIRNSAEYQRIKEKDTYDKQHCSPNVGCSIGHMITYRYIE